jgi:hypothetical protein
MRQRFPRAIRYERRLSGEQENDRRVAACLLHMFANLAAIGISHVHLGRWRRSSRCSIDIADPLCANTFILLISRLRQATHPLTIAPSASYMRWKVTPPPISYQSRVHAVSASVREVSVESSRVMWSGLATFQEGVSAPDHAVVTATYWAV